jgi:thioesterase domain-containing protein
LHLEREFVSALRRVAVAHGATLNMLMLASVELLLARLSGQDDFGIGVPSKGRSRSECEGVIGMFVNTLVLRSDVPAGGRFADLLARVKESSLEALAHEDVPFESLVRALKPTRERGRTPLFQVMYSHYEASARPHRMADLEIEVIPTFSGSTTYDLTFWVLEQGATVLAEIETNSDVFSTATGEGLCKAWRELLEVVTQAPELQLDSERFDLPKADSPHDAGRAVAHVAPRDALERALADIWSAALGIPDVGVTDDFFALGGESLAAVRIFDELQRLHRVALPLGVLFECRTVAQLASRLRGDSGSSRGAGLWNTVVPIRSAGTRPPIYCVSGLGGNPLHLHTLSDALGDDQPFYGLQHRGVDGRHEPHHSIEAMAQEFLSDVRKIQPRGPYILAGYRSAGLAAYELARRLHGLGERVALLTLLDTPSPRGAQQGVKARVQSRLAELKRPTSLAERLAGRADTWVMRARSTIGAQLSSRDPFRYRHEAVLHAGMDASRHFRPEPYDGNVLLVVVDRGEGAREGTNGWRELVRGSFEIVRVVSRDSDPIGKDAALASANAIRRAVDAVPR